MLVRHYTFLFIVTVNLIKYSEYLHTALSRQYEVLLPIPVSPPTVDFTVLETTNAEQEVTPS